MNVPCRPCRLILDNDDVDCSKPPKCMVDVIAPDIPEDVEELERIIQQSLSRPLPKTPKCCVKVSNYIDSQWEFCGYLPLIFSSFMDANGWLRTEVDLNLEYDKHYCYSVPGKRFRYEIVRKMDIIPDDQCFNSHRWRLCDCTLHQTCNGLCGCCCLICGLPRPCPNRCSYY